MTEIEREPGNLAFYNRLAREYERFFEDFERNMEEEGAWLDGAMRPLGVNTFLDACCGTGRQAIPLARRGFTVTAADASKPMLDRAAQIADRYGVRVEFLQSTFCELPDRLDRTFDAVIAMGNGLGNLQSSDEILSALRAFYACCAPNGLCLIGLKDFDTIREKRDRLHAHAVIDGPEGRTIVFDIWDVREPHLISTTFTLTGSGECWNVETAATREYMLADRELHVLALAAGFRGVDQLPHPSEHAFLLRR
jgi:ubiquinone/menaquinone biosynthesis C-methylase UbiE